MIALESITLLPSWGLPGVPWGTRWPRWGDVPKGEGGSFEVMCRWFDGKEHQTTCYPWAPAGEGILRNMQCDLWHHRRWEHGKSSYDPGGGGPDEWTWVRSRDFGDWTFSIGYYLDKGIAELTRRPIVITATIEDVRAGQRGIAARGIA